jgi:hypothetical protein
MGLTAERRGYGGAFGAEYSYPVRAAHATSRAEAITDYVQAQRIRQEVISICTALLQTESLPAADRYWAAASLAEAYIGSGDETKG